MKMSPAKAGAKQSLTKADVPAFPAVPTPLREQATLTMSGHRGILLQNSR
jgi:hypothetical protein